MAFWRANFTWPGLMLTLHMCPPLVGRKQTHHGDGA
jgi:hypothetical protein